MGDKKKTTYFLPEWSKTQQSKAEYETATKIKPDPFFLKCLVSERNRQ